MDYFNTFIAVAPDTSATVGTIPVERGGNKSIAVLEYELIAPEPYALTQSQVLFAVHAWRRNISAADLEANHAALWKAFFAKPIACMRSSPLPQTFGWGLHFDAEGKVALVARESAAYETLCHDPAITQKRALRTSRR
jgi:hypothetical protein